ncbi:prophage pi2 protein 40, partial [Bacillus thuringiensis]|nr:prophage pi2 protein 40 [Bacillus thuringiensis]MBG9523568.1 prophage pi2 protein 40 [Bacillus thuringiensis]
IDDPITWLDGFDEFPISEIIPEIMDMIQSTMGAKKK